MFINKFIIIFIFIGVSFAQDKIPIAVLELDAVGITSDQASVLTDRLRTELFLQNTFSVLEREKMKEILNEQGFQLSGCTSNECAIEAGKLIGVQKMVAGKIAKFGKLFTLNIRLIDVETGKVLKTATDDCDCEIETVLTKSLKKVANTLSEISLIYDSSNNLLINSELKNNNKSKNIYITTNENLFHDDEDKYISNKLIRYLNENGYRIVDSDGFYNIDLVFNTRSGTQVYNLFSGFADLKITIKNSKNGQIVYSNLFKDIKGIQLDYRKAKIEAIKKSWDEIESVLPEILKSLN